MNPPALVLGFLVRGLPWALIGSAGALVGGAAVRGARSAVTPPAIAGAPDETGIDGADAREGRISAGPAALLAGALAGRLLALLLRPRPMGAFLGGLAAGTLCATLVGAGAQIPTRADE